MNGLELMWSIRTEEEEEGRMFPKVQKAFDATELGERRLRKEAAKPKHLRRPAGIGNGRQTKRDGVCRKHVCIWFNCCFLYTLI